MEQVIKQILTGRSKDGYVFEDPDNQTKEVPTLPAGIYALEHVESMFASHIIYKQILPKEKYVSIEGGSVNEVMQRANVFFSKEIKAKYAELGVSHKTGMLLYGIPGTGKTITSHIIMDKLVKKYGAICIILTYRTAPKVWKAAIAQLQQLNRPIIVFCDECELILSSQETDWLTFLDGHESISNFMFIGCTNYITKISPRIKRPSRIEFLIQVSSIEEEVATQYIEEKAGKLADRVKAGIVHHAMEMNATMDAYKNAIKEFYIYHDTSTIDAFPAILKSYIRDSYTPVAVEVASEEDEEEDEGEESEGDRED